MLTSSAVVKIDCHFLPNTQLELQVGLNQTRERHGLKVYSNRLTRFRDVGSCCIREPEFAGQRCVARGVKKGGEDPFPGPSLFEGQVM